MEVDTLDVSHWLINASLKRGSLEADREWLNGDAVTIIIAGRYVNLLSQVLTAGFTFQHAVTKMSKQ